MSNKLVIASLIAGLTFGSQIVSAQQRCWTTVGSAGTVDEADLSQVALSSNTTAVSSAVNIGIVNTRYNVVAVDGVFGSGGRDLTVRFADNGEAAQVSVNVIRMNMFSGVNTPLGVLDSNDYAPSTVAQTQTVGCFAGAGAFDFENNIYYVDVALRKTGTGGNPLIRAIQICRAACVD